MELSLVLLGTHSHYQEAGREPYGRHCEVTLPVPGGCYAVDLQPQACAQHLQAHRLLAWQYTKTASAMNFRYVWI